MTATSRHARPVTLGLDTGGTFTDAVILDQDQQVVASTKSATTHGQLEVGIASAIAAVLRSAPDGYASRIEVVSVSTTLATNALVEGTGYPALLVAVGFGLEQLVAAGLHRAQRPGDEVIIVDGGHDAQGHLVRPIDAVVAEVAAAVADLDPESIPPAIAVASQFSVRNPELELELKARLAELCPARPVTCSHSLSSRLGGPRRALTALLNARLVGVIAELLDAIGETLTESIIDAPLMVVRGDGSVIAERVALDRPVETILSGPAASVVGAARLSGVSDAVVCDIGGTTTDIGVVTHGKVRSAPDGALVAGLRTMVDAIEMRTIGLGGDSEIRLDGRDPNWPVTIGPRRAIPLARLAVAEPETVRRLLDVASGSGTLSPAEIRFVVPVAKTRPTWLIDRGQRQILDRLDGTIRSELEVAPTATAKRALDVLQQQGQVRIATFTPTDAFHVIDEGWGLDKNAARAIAELAASRQGPTGARIATDARELCERVIETVAASTAKAVLDAALADSGLGDDSDYERLIDRSFDERRGSSPGVLRASLSIGCPFVGVGASAALVHPRVGELLAAPTIIPASGPFANALGAAIADVVVARSATITQPRRGKFVLHLDEQPAFGTVELARADAERRLDPLARSDAERAGAHEPTLTTDWDETIATVEGRPWFVEGVVTIRASGPPHRAVRTDTASG